jgi:hypothetical protein
MINPKNETHSSQQHLVKISQNVRPQNELCIVPESAPDLNLEMLHEAPKIWNSQFTIGDTFVSKNGLRFCGAEVGILLWQGGRHFDFSIVVWYRFSEKTWKLIYSLIIFCHTCSTFGCYPRGVEHS